MEIKVSKKILYVAGGLVVILIVGGGVFAKHGGSRAVPYAGVADKDLPTVVGEPSFGGPKIPFTATANYQEYAPDVLTAALANGKATLLYFYADWCGSCRTQEPINQEFFRKALTQKLDLNGFRVNVDANKPLMRQYGINYQHSYVLLDKTGKSVDKFFGDHSEEELMQKVRQGL